MNISVLEYSKATTGQNGTLGTLNGIELATATLITSQPGAFVNSAASGREVAEKWQRSGEKVADQAAEQAAENEQTDCRAER